MAASYPSPLRCKRDINLQISAVRNYISLSCNSIAISPGWLINCFVEQQYRNDLRTGENAACAAPVCAAMVQVGVGVSVQRTRHRTMRWHVEAGCVQVVCIAFRSTSLPPSLIRPPCASAAQRLHARYSGVRKWWHCADYRNWPFLDAICRQLATTAA